MEQLTIYQKIRDAVNFVRTRADIEPKVGIVLGSGLGTIAEAATHTTVLNYSEIPHFHGTSVEGHAGKMVLGRYADVPAVFLQGRFHVYEGYPMDEVVFPVRTLCGMGIQQLILTNAAGGVNTRFRPGDLMLIEDHINLMGDNPLKGKHLSDLGPRFPDLTEAYSKILLEIFQQCGTEIGIPLKTGVYAGLLGPTYETPAEVRMLRVLGADAVGMSTVPEAIAANHLGVQVLGLSCITNLAAGITPQKLTHDEVITNSRIAAKNLAKLLEIAVPRLVRQASGASRSPLPPPLSSDAQL